MSNRVLILGDMHIPTRRDAIPEEFYNYIKESQYDMTLITGDLVRESDMRAALPPLSRCFIVTGNMDFGSSYNFHEQIQVDNFDILLLHGTQLRPRGNIEQLWDILQHIGGDVAVHGHTHRAAIDLYKDKLFLNPGTITGATGGSGGRTDASFIEIAVDRNQMRVILHSTDWRVVKRTEVQYKKQNEQITRIS
jgi:vacuolar protein sorting-associated protein 29